MPPSLTPGKNIALKIPPDQYEATVAFYRDVLGLPPRGTASDGAVGFGFGGKDLWLDKVATLSQAEVWLEVRADDLDAAAGHLAGHGVVRCDDIEPLPDGFKGFWIKNPAGLVHLVSAGGPAAMRLDHIQLAMPPGQEDDRFGPLCLIASASSAPPW